MLISCEQLLITCMKAMLACGTTNGAKGGNCKRHCALARAVNMKGPSNQRIENRKSSEAGLSPKKSTITKNGIGMTSKP